MKMGDITYKKITTTPINLDNSIIIESDAILALQKLPSASVQCIHLYRMGFEPRIKNIWSSLNLL